MQNVLFVLSKVLRLLLASPIFVCLALAAAALALLPAPTRVRKFFKTAGLVACCTLFVLSLPVTTFALAKVWEVPSGSTEEIRGRGPFDAIVVLGGSVLASASGQDRVELNDTAERLLAAAELQTAGVAPVILATGGSGLVLDSGQKEAPLMARVLEQLGVPKDRILLEDASRNTFENATLSKPVLSTIGARRVILVTSAWHMRRARAIFAKAGYDFEPFAADSVLEPLYFPGDLLPDTYALDKTTRLLTEMVGFLSYRIMGRL